MAENLGIPYSTFYRLQLAFAELDSVPDVENALSEMTSDEPSKNALKWLYEHKRSGQISVESESFDLESLDLQAETAALYNDVKNLRLDGTTMDVRETLAVSKLQAELLTRVLEMYERSKRNRQIGEFVEYISQILTDEQKEKVLKDFGEAYSSVKD